MTSKTSSSAAKKPKRRYAPGDTVPQSGVYEAFHASHRVTQTLVLLEGKGFPHCARCKEKVRFELKRAVKNLNEQNAPVVHVIGVFLPEAA